MRWSIFARLVTTPSPSEPVAVALPGGFGTVDEFAEMLTWNQLGIISKPVVLLDIEQRRSLEHERDQATQLLRAFIEAVPGVVYAKDTAGRMLLANRGVAELAGAPLEAFLGKTVMEFIPNKAQAAVLMENDRRIMEGGVAVTLEDDPGRDMGEARILGHRFFFSPEEVEPLDFEVPHE